ncbi:caspase, EACC1-associated type [Sphaerospermopsis aphanizomenoides]|uniref:caspase, EACC1-associated type n=1 Tax=Sphaerospermopsis aphanizomenoides TaxID=459663 RepID=UPI001F37EB42|nr:GUN4 domain-containing protein [Sphaerospermopsis aphanizomenoides]
MGKFALLIGVSEYQHGLNSLKGVVQDLEKMQRVLLHPDMGGFAEGDVRVLKNPGKTEMEKAIEQLFYNRNRDDLVLLYFAGHGILDFDSNKFYLTNSKTERDNYKNLVKATATEANWIKDRMNESFSRRMVVILDSCFSGAFAKERGVRSADITVDIKTQLGGEGRAILASSSATEYSQEESSGGIYTRYIVEGIETGAADTDNNGLISVQELHAFAYKKIREAAPAMKPQIDTSQEGYTIKIAKAPKGDSKLEYRKSVEQYLRDGKISPVNRRSLKIHQNKLGLSDDEVNQIQNELLEPYRKYQANLKEYEEVVQEAVQHEANLSQITFDELKDLQQLLNLRDEDVKPIHDKLISPLNHSSEKTVIAPPQTDDLSSERGIDYIRLCNLLAAHNWKEADKETYEVMIKAVGKKSGDWVTTEELLNFPCKDLRTIDQLWVKYSGGRFGFSVQKEIYLSIGGKLDGMHYPSTVDKLGKEVAWKNEQDKWINYSRVNFSTSASRGHLPNYISSMTTILIVPSKGWEWLAAKWLTRAFMETGIGQVGVIGSLCLFSRINTCKV